MYPNDTTQDSWLVSNSHKLSNGAYEQRTQKEGASSCDDQSALLPTDSRMIAIDTDLLHLKPYFEK